MGFSEENNFGLDAIARLCLAVAALDNLYVIFVKDNFLLVVTGMLFIQKSAFQIIVLYLYVLAMDGRGVGARIYFYFNVKQIQQWEICLVYSADVSFQWI